MNEQPMPSKYIKQYITITDADLRRIVEPKIINKKEEQIIGEIVRLKNGGRSGITKANLLVNSSEKTP